MACMQVGEYPLLVAPDRAPTVLERVYLKGNILAGNSCPANSTRPSLQCRAGFYCPEPGVSNVCPAGYFCKEGSQAPELCPRFTSCPEGSGWFCPLPWLLLQGRAGSAAA
jgi:hypothetical protein